VIEVGGRGDTRLRVGLPFKTTKRVWAKKKIDLPAAGD
jgi:hypothetical protein